MLIFYVFIFIRIAKNRLMLLILSTSLFPVYSVSFGLRLVRQPLSALYLKAVDYKPFAHNHRRELRFGGKSRF